MSQLRAARPTSKETVAPSSSSQGELPRFRLLHELQALQDARPGDGRDGEQEGERRGVFTVETDGQTGGDGRAAPRHAGQDRHRLEDADQQDLAVAELWVVAPTRDRTSGPEEQGAGHQEHDTRQQRTVEQTQLPKV